MKSPDDLNDLFSSLRASPTDADPDRVAPGLETRVLARVRAERRADGLAWFWRWSAVFGAAAAICAVLVMQNYDALADDSLGAFDDGLTILTWFN